MTPPSVVFEGVWKKFRRGERHDSFRDLIPATVKRLARSRPSAAELGGQEFWAIRDVSFEVAPGDALGIIGPNGAGKSTILKLLSRILKPTRGRAEVRGRAGALIEVAAGFHPDLSGRENVFLQGAIMGMKRAEIARKFDDIVEFAGVAEFIDTPVKRYSSGMNARLGFAIAAHLDPDVLLIDEVLSVGDAAFQERCVEHMHTLVARGIPLVFISHNLPAVLQLCTRALVVDRGVVRFDGTAADAIQQYRLVPPARQAEAAGERAARIGIVAVDLMNDRLEPACVFNTFAGMRIRIQYDASEPVADAAFAIDIYRADGVHCVGVNTLMTRQDLGVLHGPGQVELVVPRLNLLPGSYLTSVGILNGAGGTYDLRSRAYPFAVISDRRDLGVMYLDHEWTHRQFDSGERTVAGVAAGASKDRI